MTTTCHKAGYFVIFFGPEMGYQGGMSDVTKNHPPGSLPPSELYPSALKGDSDDRFMVEAIRQAVAAAEVDEVPVGAVVVYQGEIIARGHNQTRTLSDPTAHAEMIVLTQAAAHLGDWRLGGCSLYVTLEPCTMCAGAMVLGRVDRLVFGAEDPKAGACGTLYNVVQDERLNHQVAVTGGVLAEPCGLLLREFFERKRADGKK